MTTQGSLNMNDTIATRTAALRTMMGMAEKALRAALAAQPDSLLVLVCVGEQLLAHCREPLARCRRIVRAEVDFEAGLEQTIDWYRANGAWAARVKSGAYQDYYERNYANR